MGRRVAGGLLGFGAGALTIIAGYHYDTTLFGMSAFWLLLGAAFFFADGGFAIVGPYAAEVWPSHLRTTGMGSAYGFGGIGKIIGPVGLALIVGSNNYLKPDVPLTRDSDRLRLSRLLVPDGGGRLPASSGVETRGKSIEQIDKELNAAADVEAPGDDPARLRGGDHESRLQPILAGDREGDRPRRGDQGRGRRGAPTRSRRYAGCRATCSTGCMRPGCSDCCCRARPTGSKPIPSPSSMPSRPSPGPTPRRRGA